ncbi:MAG: hypothetical protein K0V04_36165 [Deltaproteobacteria bacterium]|nr:hypothetical protein [Deltaproteobacteria bacterium]
MTNTPLSDLITRYTSSKRDEDRARLYATFVEAQVGVTIVDPPDDVPIDQPVDSSGMGMAIHELPNGLQVLRACADPEVFVERYDPTVNARLNGRALVEMAAKLGPECGGVLLASAASKHSVLIPRERFAAVLSPGHSPRKPWWKLW